MSRWVASVLLVALVACGGSSPGGPGVGPPTGNVSPTPTPVPTPTLTPTPSPTPTPEPPAGSPPCGDLLMRLTRPNAGITVTNNPQVVEATVGQSVVRVDFYYHIDVAGGGAPPSAQAVMDPPVLIQTRNAPPWRVNWQLPPGCGNTVSLLAIGFDACGGGNDSPIITVQTCRQ